MELKTLKDMVGSPELDEIVVETKELRQEAIKLIQEFEKNRPTPQTTEVRFTISKWQSITITREVVAYLTYFYDITEEELK